MVDGNLDADTIDELSHKYELFADILKEYDDDEFIIDDRGNARGDAVARGGRVIPKKHFSL